MTLRELIYSGLTTINGTSSIYYDHFPDDFNNETDTGVLFFYSNPDNQNSFDKKEMVKVYNVDFIVRSPSLDTAESIRGEIKPVMYGLQSTPYFGSVSLVVQEQPFYEDTLKTWEVFTSFDLRG